MSELPALEGALLDAAHRRYGRAWWRPAVPRVARRLAASVAVAGAVAAIVVAAVTVLDGSGPAGGDEVPATRPAESWTTTVDQARGFEVSLPRGWRLSAESLTPRLTDPRELLSAGTFPLGFREGPCNHMPIGALRSMGPNDGFVTILERGRGPRSREFAARPPSFAEQARPRRGDVTECLDGRPDLIEYWMPFTDADRSFYALVVLGPQAPEDVRAEAFAILDRMRFDPAVQPDWGSSG